MCKRMKKLDYLSKYDMRAWQFHTKLHLKYRTVNNQWVNPIKLLLCPCATLACNTLHSGPLLWGSRRLTQHLRFLDFSIISIKTFSIYIFSNFTFPIFLSIICLFNRVSKSVLITVAQRVWRYSILHDMHNILNIVPWMLQMICMLWMDATNDITAVNGCYKWWPSGI